MLPLQVQMLTVWMAAKDRVRSPRGDERGESLVTTIIIIGVFVIAALAVTAIIVTAITTHANNVGKTITSTPSS